MFRKIKSWLKKKEIRLMALENDVAYLKLVCKSLEDAVDLIEYISVLKDHKLVKKSDGPFDFKGLPIKEYDEKIKRLRESGYHFHYRAKDGREVWCKEGDKYSPQVKRFKKAGLMGCFDDTGVNSENYKEFLYSTPTDDHFRDVTQKDSG